MEKAIIPHGERLKMNTDHNNKEFDSRSRRIKTASNSFTGADS